MCRSPLSGLGDKSSRRDPDTVNVSTSLVTCRPERSFLTVLTGRTPTDFEPWLRSVKEGRHVIPGAFTDRPGWLQKFARAVAGFVARLTRRNVSVHVGASDILAVSSMEVGRINVQFGFSLATAERQSFPRTHGDPIVVVQNPLPGPRRIVQAEPQLPVSPLPSRAAMRGSS